MDINALIRDETERMTDIGREIKQYSGQIPAECNVRLLRKIIYGKDAARNRFQLTGFPDTDEQADAFEKVCSLKAIIYATGKENYVEIKNQNINNPSIDAAFAKKFKLRPMREWSREEFADKLGANVKWYIIAGRALSGKSTIANNLVGMVQGKVLDMKDISEKCKARLGTEDEPFEGDVPDEEVEKDVLAIIDADRAAGAKFTYIFDGWSHKSATAFV